MVTNTIKDVTRKIDSLTCLSLSNEIKEKFPEDENAKKQG